MTTRKKPREPEDEDEIKALFPEAPEIDWGKMEKLVSHAAIIELPEDDSILKDEDMNDPELLAAYEELHREETAAAAAAAAAKAPPASRAPPATLSTPPVALPHKAPAPARAPIQEDDFAALEQSMAVEESPSSKTPPTPAVALPTPLEPEHPPQQQTTATTPSTPGVFQVRTQGLMPDFTLSVPQPRAEAKAKSSAAPPSPTSSPPPLADVSESSKEVAAAAATTPDPRRAELELQRRGWGRAWQEAKARGDPTAVKQALLIIKKFDALLHASELPAVLPTFPTPPPPQPVASTPPPSAQTAPPAAAVAAKPVAKSAAHKPSAASSQAARMTSTTATARSKAPAAKAAAPPPSSTAISERDIASVPHKLELPNIASILENMPDGEKYRDIEKFMRAQVESIHKKIVDAKAADDKALAIQCYRLRKDLLLHYHHLGHLASLRLPLPPIICVPRTLQKEVAFRYLPEDVLELSVLSASSIPMPTGFSSIDPYVYIQVPYPNETAPLTLQTGTSKDTMNPTWETANSLSIRIDRKRGGAFEKFVMRRKVPIEIYHRRVLRRDVLLAKGELRLQRLVDEAEVIEDVPLQSAFSNTKTTHATVQIRLRLRTPLNGRQFINMEEFILMFFAPTHANAHLLAPPTTPDLYALMPQSAATAAAVVVPPQPPPPALVTPTPPPVVVPPPPTSKPPAIPVVAVAAAAAAPSTPQPAAPQSPLPHDLPPAGSKAAPPSGPSKQQQQQQQPPPSSTSAAKPKAAKKPAAAVTTTDTDEVDIEEWESVENMVSNNVMEAEMASVTKQINLLQSQRKEVPEDLADRKNALEIKMKLLMLSVQTEQLSMEDYMSQLKTKAEAERKFAAKCVAMHTPEGKEAAKRALVRAKIMENEMTEQAEEGGE